MGSQNNTKEFNKTHSDNNEKEGKQLETARGHYGGEKKTEFSVPLQKTGKTQGESTVNHAMAGTLDGNSWSIPGQPINSLSTWNEIISDRKFSGCLFIDTEYRIYSSQTMGYKLLINLSLCNYNYYLSSKLSG